MVLLAHEGEDRRGVTDNSDERCCCVVFFMGGGCGGNGGGAIWVFMEQMRERFGGHDCSAEAEGRANILIGLNEFGVGGVPARASCKNFNRPLMKRANLQ